MLLLSDGVRGGIDAIGNRFTKRFRLSQLRWLRSLEDQANAALALSLPNKTPGNGHQPGTMVSGCHIHVCTEKKSLEL